MSGLNHILDLILQYRGLTFEKLTVMKNQDAFFFVFLQACDGFGIDAAGWSATK
jgi:hypothetical protein